jgi:hypothetical protein
MKFFLVVLLFPLTIHAQIRWRNVDSLYQPLPNTVHVYFTDEAIDTGRFRAFYVTADLKDKHLDFTTDTTLYRRLTPSRYYDRNGKPLLIVNGTFFSLETGQNLNLVIKDGNIISYNVHTVPGRGKDTLTYKHPYPSAIGISKDRFADVAWLITDSTSNIAFYSQVAIAAFKDSVRNPPMSRLLVPIIDSSSFFMGMESMWDMQTAIGGGPVLVQRSDVRISNNEELKFAGKAINDKHPRTAMGYTYKRKLIILVIEGRNPEAGGATLEQEAQILKDLGCAEALNLDGGGSSCLLINGKETIKPSDKEGQRAVPAVFIIRNTK